MYNIPMVVVLYTYSFFFIGLISSNSKKNLYFFFIKIKITQHTNLRILSTHHHLHFYIKWKKNVPNEKSFRFEFWSQLLKNRLRLIKCRKPTKKNIEEKLKDGQNKIQTESNGVLHVTYNNIFKVY